MVMDAQVGEIAQIFSKSFISNFLKFTNIIIDNFAKYFCYAFQISSVNFAEYETNIMQNFYEVSELLSTKKFSKRPTIQFVLNTTKDYFD